MAYTPVELRHVRVGRSLFGYNRAMVEQVIEEVAESFEATWRERGELSEKVEQMEKQIGELRQREDLLTQTLIAAEQAASDVRERARHEAEMIVTEAHNEARAVGHAAQADRERLLTESRRIEAMLRAALGMIEERAAAVATSSSPNAPSTTDSSTPSGVADSTDSGEKKVTLPPVIAEPPAEPWAREDTREFEPIAPTPIIPTPIVPTPVAPTPIVPPQSDRPVQYGGGSDAHSPAAGSLHRLPRSQSHDFDWGE